MENFLVGLVTFSPCRSGIDSFIAVRVSVTNLLTSERVLEYLSGIQMTPEYLTDCYALGYDLNKAKEYAAHNNIGLADVVKAVGSTNIRFDAWAKELELHGYAISDFNWVKHALFAWGSREVSHITAKFEKI